MASTDNGIPRLDLLIEGMRDRDVTLIVMRYDDITVTGHAMRDPRDPPDRDLAMDLALGRAFTALGNRLQRRARGRIKHADDVSAMREIQRARNWARAHVDIAGAEAIATIAGRVAQGVRESLKR